jgi:hypothetical protein
LPVEPLPTRIRLLGFLPFIFFIAQGLHYWQIDQWGHLLWMCNVGNLLLAAGLFLVQPLMIRVAVIWSVPGFFVWLRYVVWEWFHYATLDWGAVTSGTLAHIGGLAVGLIVLRRVRVDRRAWFYAFIWYLAIQLISRVVTPPALNVNVSHHIYEGWQGRFSSYFYFWVVLTIAVVIGLRIIGWCLERIWPCRIVAASPS